MKKLIPFLIIALILLLTFPFGALSEGASETGAEVPAQAETIDPAPAPDPGTPYTWEYLASIAGATALTLLIVQFLKVPLDRVWRIPTRLFVYFIALLILLVATAFTTGLTLQNGLMAFVNAFLVALTAYGAYEVTFAKLDNKYK